MLRQLLCGGVISLVNIAIHALAMAAVIGASRVASARHVAARPTLRLVVTMIATVSVLMGFHLAEIGVWSLGYALLDVAPPGADRFYFAFVNYATLGYGDVVPVADWRLLGPMAAMNGVLLFGWSTAVIFEVLWKALPQIDKVDAER
jgi:Ion channel